MVVRHLSRRVYSGLAFTVSHATQLFVVLLTLMRNDDDGVRDESGKKVLGKVKVGDTKLQALERLSQLRTGGGLYDNQDTGLLDSD